MAQVSCVQCGVTLDTSKADITGRGYRCTQCSLKASLAADGGHNDVMDHLTVEERVKKAKLAGSEMIGGGALAFAGAVVFLVIPIPFHGIIGACMTFAGLGAVSHGYLTKREMTGQRTS
jgi:hypothetical protein